MTTYRPTRHLRRGLTLLEVVLAMGILALVSSMTYWFYASSLSTRRQGMSEAHSLRLVRVLLDRMATEIRQASALTTDNRVGIRGDAERIWLSSVRVPTKASTEDRRRRMKRPPSEYDLVKVSYHIVRHPEILEEDESYEKPLGLARAEILVPRPDSAETGEAFEGEYLAEGAEDAEDVPPADQTEEDVALEALEEALLEEEDESPGIGLASEINWEELYATEIRYLRFCYFDGNKWWDTWDVPGDNPLPQLVMVTAGFTGCAPFGEELGLTPNEEFCECLNRDPVDCERLPPDMYSMIVRVTQSDPLFRSRVTREGQALVEQLTSEEPDEEEETQ